MTKALESDAILCGLFRADCPWLVLECSRLQVHVPSKSRKYLPVPLRSMFGCGLATLLSREFGHARLLMWTQTPKISYMGVLIANAMEDVASWSCMQRTAANS